MTELQDKLLRFVDDLQQAVGPVGLDSRRETALRLLVLEGLIPTTTIQPYAVVVRGILVMQLLRLARLCGPRVVAAVAPLIPDIYAAEADRLPDAYRAAVLPIVAVLQSDSGDLLPRPCSEPRINTALGQIRQCATRPEALRVEDVARVCHMSKWHLERLLRRYTGTTFKQHVRLVRMAAAQQLLRSPNLTMKEIAARTGYLYETEFGRDFKLHFGITPTAWRRAETG
jgi:AraC-like DNA-binding protein